MWYCKVCSQRQKTLYLDRKVNSELYDRYLEWKYSVGNSGSETICFDCYNKHYGQLEESLNIS